jgi:tryptophanyl-tRNA synthetase
VKRILTGIKPTGTPHVGNYLGAIRPALRHAADPALEACYFIADYHALTTVHERAALDRQIHEVAATWLACGLDPTRTLFYRQSDVPEIFELSWILGCFTSKGWMNKAHAYKAHVAAAREAGAEDVDAGVDMGLYQYPVLMAADILAFDTDAVPVGPDQLQHLEIARDIAERINHVYRAELLKLPVPRFDQVLVPGMDGRKMSKSYGNTLPLFVPAKELKKAVMRIVTDSLPPEAPKDPDSSVVFQIHRHLLTPVEIEELAATYRGGIGWGDAKKLLAERLEEMLAEPRRKYEALMAEPATIDRLLAEGAGKAREIARPVLARVRQAIGM